MMLNCLFIVLAEGEEGLRACLAIKRMSEEEVERLVEDIGKAFAQLAYTIAAPTLLSLFTYLHASLVSRLAREDYAGATATSS